MNVVCKLRVRIKISVVGKDRHIGVPGHATIFDYTKWAEEDADNYGIRKLNRSKNRVG